jgi:hypothetical protein
MNPSEELKLPDIDINNAKEQMKADDLTCPLSSARQTLISKENTVELN